MGNKTETAAESRRQDTAQDITFKAYVHRGFYGFAEQSKEGQRQRRGPVSE